MGIPFGDSPLLSLVPRTYFRWDSCWNFPAGASELIPFVARSDRFCYSRSVEIPSRGFLLVFPRWGFTLLVSFARNSVFPRRGFTVLLIYYFSLIYVCSWRLDQGERRKSFILMIDGVPQ